MNPIPIPAPHLIPQSPPDQSPHRSKPAGRAEQGMAAAPPPGRDRAGEGGGGGGRSAYLVELEHVGAEADAVALVDADVERHAAERGAPGAARERHVAGLPAELHEAPPRAGLGEAQAEVGREVEPRAQRPHGLLPDLHHTRRPAVPRLLLLFFEETPRGRGCYGRRWRSAQPPPARMPLFNGPGEGGAEEDEEKMNKEGLTMERSGGREGGFGGNAARGAREGSGEAGRKARGECNAMQLCSTARPGMK